MSALSQERWQVVSPYLDRALELTADERAAWIDSLRAADPVLATDVMALLDERAVLNREGFLAGGAPIPPPSLAGQTIGAYTLESLIGQGGMGSVWLARRADGRYEGQVAVKLLNANLVGGAGEARFKREGRILARLTHPHIAHLIDAGVSAGGQPYLVLEHVEGERIDQYCDTRKLGIPERIELFRDVLSAVAHAHANLIVHRDVKPSNVLVSTGGQAKLLDFGIAKLLEDEAGGSTALTREGGRALTPEFAAPEQVTGDSVTTATDVYSLGALLYLLLSGAHPAGEAVRSAAELLKAIVDTEPPRPSDVAVRKTTLSAEERTRNAASRATTPERLGGMLAGDLDTIVAKALKKRPVERYASVSALADDLGRYLDHRPIRARPDTPAYRAAKFVRRHRLPVAMAALAVLALAGGLAGTLSQARRAARQAALAEAQRGRADEEARQASIQRDFALRQLSRAEAINDLNAFLLSDAAPSGKPFTAGELLVRAEHVVERDRGETGENRVEMLVAIGRQCETQDQVAEATRVLEQAYQLATTLPERWAGAKAACALGSTISRAGDAARAEALVREGLAALPTEPQFALDRAFCLLRGSEVAREHGEVATGIERIEDARRLLTEPRLASASAQVGLYIDLGEAYRMAGRHLEASAAFEQAFSRLSALGRDDTERAGTLLNNWGLALEALGRPLEAERLYRKAIRIGSADAAERGVSPVLLNNLARALRELHRIAEAVDHAERAYTAAGQRGDQIAISQALFERARGYRERGDVGRAADALAELEPRLKRMLPAGHAAFAALEQERGLIAQARGDLASARAALDRAVSLAEASTQRADYLPRALLRRSDLELQMHQPGEARADAARALQSLPNAQAGTYSSWRGRANLVLGRALEAQGQRTEARVAFATALRELEPSLGPEHPETRDARQRAGVLSTTTDSGPISN